MANKKNVFRKANNPDFTKTGAWWAKDVIFWALNRTLYLSVPFTFMLPRARELAQSWKGPVIAGGPAVYIQPDYVKDFAKIGYSEDVEPISPLAMHNPLATYTTRGCPNNCSFCLSPDTPILMSDLTVKPLKDVEVGDEVYGVDQNKQGERFFWKTTKTKVTGKMSRTTEAYKITTQDNNTLICSGDHRWLTIGRGWKFTTDSDKHPQRKHLTLNDSIQKIGDIYKKEPFTHEYKKGYLEGMMDGDGCVWKCIDKRSGFTNRKIRIALADMEALIRSKEFMQDMNLHPTEIRTFYEGNANHREIFSFELTKKAEVECLLNTLQNTPEFDDTEYMKGYVAGFFDSDGSVNPTAKIVKSNLPKIEWLRACLDRLGIENYVEPDFQEREGKLNMHRVVIGKVSESLKLYQLTRPAIERKWKDFLNDRMPDNGEKVHSIEHIGPMELMDIETESGNFIAAGSGSDNCAAYQIDGEYREIPDFLPRPMVCDNNFLSCSKKHFNRAIDKLKPLPYVDIQGIEARKVTKEKASRLAELKHVRLIMGFDHVKEEKRVHDAIKILQSAGIKDIETYVLCGYKDTKEDTLHRLNKSLEWGARPFPMRYQPLTGKHSLEKSSYVDPNWTHEDLKRIMTYWTNLTKYEHIPFDEFIMGKEDHSSSGFGFKGA